jgi:small subunit ribosomal protein S16
VFSASVPSTQPLGDAGEVDGSPAAPTPPAESPPGRRLCYDHAPPRRGSSPVSLFQFQPDAPSVQPDRRAPKPQKETLQMVKIRLRRMGSRNHPFYRVVVSDARKTPTGSALAEIGYYDPRKQPAVVQIDREELDRWVAKGATLSPTVQKLVKKQQPAAAAATPAPAAP